MTKRIFGPAERPRVVFQGFSKAVIEKAIELVPIASAGSRLDELELESWDLFVTNGRIPYRLPQHLFVLGMGPDFGHCNVPISGRRGEYVRVMWSEEVVRAQEFALPDLPPAIEDAVLKSLLPSTQQRTEHSRLRPFAVSPKNMQDATKLIRPFLQTRSGYLLAGSFLRAGGSAECWCLPKYVEDDMPVWLEVAIQEWSKVRPDVFPPSPLVAWVKRPEWQTPPEKQRADEYASMRARHTEERMELEAQQRTQEEAVLADLEVVKQEADRNERTLLTGAGDALLQVTATCLIDLGFDVKRMDELRINKADLLEDLQVLDSDVPSWITLVEVRGYTGGAKVNDLLRLGRFRRRYLQDTKQDANAVWYIVNQFVGQDPSTRQPILASNQADLDAFAEDGGLAIDTAELFQLWMAVRERRIDNAQARAILRQAVGRLSVPNDILAG
jgi:hypothetical protein